MAARRRPPPPSVKPNPVRAPIDLSVERPAQVAPKPKANPTKACGCAGNEPKKKPNPTKVKGACCAACAAKGHGKRKNPTELESSGEVTTLEAPTEHHEHAGAAMTFEQHREAAERHMRAIAEESGALVRSIEWNARQIFEHAQLACLAVGAPSAPRVSPTVVSGFGPTSYHELPPPLPSSPPAWPGNSPTMYSALNTSEEEAQRRVSEAWNKSAEVKQRVGASFQHFYDQGLAAGKTPDRASEAASRITGKQQEAAAHVGAHAAFARQALLLGDRETAVHQAHHAMVWAGRLEQNGG